MRLRNIPGSREAIAESQYVIHEEETRAGSWHEIFENDHPIYIEIGMGKEGTVPHGTGTQKPGY